MSSGVCGLRVYAEAKKGEIEELPASSTRYRAVESIIDLGLSVLETPEGRESLVDVATATITQRREKKKQHLYGNRSFDEMSMWTDDFLARLRGNFPDVYLVRIEGEGMAIKYDWGDDMANYDPKTAAELHINRTIILNMVNAETQAHSHSHNMFKFQMAITIAHEMIHLLISYLTGKKRPHTPPGVSLASYGNTATGESGRYWESLLLGGVVEFYEDSQDPLGNTQAGRPYLIVDGRNSASARLISTNYINEFLSSRFSFPIRTSNKAKPTTRSELRRTSRETSALRRGKNANACASPTRASASHEAVPGPSNYSGDDSGTQQTIDTQSWPDGWYTDPWAKESGKSTRWFENGTWSTYTGR